LIEKHCELNANFDHFRNAILPNFQYFQDYQYISQDRIGYSEHSRIFIFQLGGFFF